MRRAFWSIGLVGLALAFPAGATAATAVRVQGTTDVRDAGFVDDVLVPGFHAAFPQYTLTYIAVGTGQALTNARAGAGDAVLTHAPSLEAQFVADGYSAEPVGRAIFYSDYVIVGPLDDPAGVLTNAPHDAVTAFERIATAGAAGNATFVSRGDNSGTNAEEEQIWHLTDGIAGAGGLTPSPNGPNRDHPTDTTWYKTTGAGQAQNVIDTDQCSSGSFPNGGCYTIVDRGTFNRQLNLNPPTVTNLKIVADKNTGLARGGTGLLLNPFHAYAVNPAKFSPGTIDLAGAKAFLDYLTSPELQARLASYPNTAQPALFADALPSFTNVSSVPSSVNAGDTVKVTGQLHNLFPGSAPVSGAPLTLDRASNLISLFFTPLSSGRSASGGSFSLSAPMKRTAALRVSFGRFGDLSPTTRDLGVVHVKAVVGKPTASASYRRLRLRGTLAPDGDRSAATLLVIGHKAGQADRTLARRALPATGATYHVTAKLAPGRYTVHVRYQDPGAVDSGDSASVTKRVPSTSVRIRSLRRRAHERVRFSALISPAAASRRDVLFVQGRPSGHGKYRRLATVRMRKGHRTRIFVLRLPARKWQLRLQYRRTGTGDVSVSATRFLRVR
jgi:tungstate transport system substrate-binding protein